MTDDRPWMTAFDAQYAALREIRLALRTAAALGVTDLKARAWLSVSGRSGPVLERADTFAWSPDSTASVEVASHTLPEQTAFTADMLPARDGWWWTGPLPQLPHVVALLWETDDWGVNLWAFTPHEDRAVPYDFVRWKFGAPMQRVFAEIAESERATYTDGALYGASVARFFCAGCLWLQQRILLVGEGHVERHARRRVEREHQLAIAPSVKVVELRRVDYDPHTATSQRLVDWSCRWIVSGHWRRQAVKDGEHKTIFIQAHVKGPADKPLITPTRTVFEVTR